MTLPKQTLPLFDLVVPSTKQKVRYRQFTVREEKALMQARQSEDVKMIIAAIEEVIKACVPAITDPSSLAVFDMEYILTKIRAKSVGETVDLLMPCEADAEHQDTPVRVFLDKIEVQFKEGHNKMIPLFDDVGIVMKYPTVESMERLEKANGVDAIIECIDYIYNEHEMFHAEDSTKEELSQFLDDLTDAQIKKIEDTFFRSMPVFEYPFEYKCMVCGHEHKKVIKGLSNFFA